VAATACVAATAVLAGCSLTFELGAGSTASGSTLAAPAGLADLAIAAEDPSAPYSAELRDAEWGDGWDSRGDGCDTRDLVLRHASVGELELGKGCQPRCVSQVACWTSPYDGKPTHEASELQIDHVVPVAEAARSRVRGSGPAGDPAVAEATVWSPAEKHAFYEDMDNLIAVTGRVNASKSDGDPAEWRPMNGAR
jgi:Protein of unknown function (DUF1524)